MAVIACTTAAQVISALSTAAGGDEITIPAGAPIVINATLPKRTGVSSPIVIRSNAAPGDLPAAGVRIDPTYEPFMGCLQSTSTVPILSAAKGAHHFTFRAIYFPAKPEGMGNLIDMGGDFGSGAVLADVCTDMAFDRCMSRGHSVAGQLRFAHLGVTRLAITNCYVDRYGSQGQQGNIFSMINGEGDHTITNNYLSGSTQPILYGGGAIRARVVASVVSATVSSATLSSTTDLRVGQRIAFLAESGTRRRWPKCLSVNHTTNAITFEPLDVVPDIPGEARWGVVEKNIEIGRNYISHDLNVVQNGVLQPTTGVARSLIAGSFPGSTTATYAVQAKATGYVGQEARGAASAQTASISITTSQGVRVTWSAVENISTATNGGYYIYRTSAGVITRFTVGNVLTFDDVGTGGTVVASIPSATVFVGWIGIELKQGINVRIHSNIIENTYKGSFGGECILIKCANQEGTAAFLSTEDVLVENNVCRNTWGFGTVSGSESGVTFTMDIQPRPVENLTFRNNLNYNSLNTNLGANQSALSRYFITVVNGAKNVQFIHNTTTHVGTGCFYVEQNVRGPLSGFLVRDNMLRGNTYLVGSNNGFGATGLANATTPGAYTFSYNAVATPSNASSQITGNNNQYATYATWVTEFVDGTGTDTDDYALDGGSTYENDASDGTDIGCDIAALNTAISGVTTGTAAGAGSPVVLTAGLPDGTQGVVYSQSLAASGGTPPYTWSVVSGSVPTGLTLSSAGVLSGTPTTAGGFTFTARATDSAAQTGSRAFTVTIAAAAAIPVITATSLANATQNIAYSAQLTATEGIQPYSWSVVSGALPAGLSLNVDTGAISGTPTVSGPFVFGASVQDSIGSVSLTQTFSITVAPAVPTEPIPGRPLKWNLQELIGFRRPTPPTVDDSADTGDIWINTTPGIRPEGFIGERSGNNLTWNKWPSNEARVREIAQEEQLVALKKVETLTPAADTAPVRLSTVGSTLVGGSNEGLRRATVHLVDSKLDDSDNALLMVDVRQTSHTGTLQRTGIHVKQFSEPDNGGDTSGILCVQTGGGNGLSCYRFPDLRPSGLTDYSANDPAGYAGEFGTRANWYAVGAFAYAANSGGLLVVLPDLAGPNASGKGILVNPQNNTFDTRIAYGIGTAQVNAADTNMQFAVYMSGAILMTEIGSAPAAPASNKAVLYTRDNGSGKTQIVARFPTGAVQVIATEP